MDADSRTTKRIRGKIMELKIGEIFKFEKVILQVVEDNEYTSNCDGCYFKYNCSGFMSAICTPHTRKDGKFIKYKKIKL